jgi:hypothetical protein
MKSSARWVISITRRRRVANSLPGWGKLHLVSEASLESRGEGVQVDPSADSPPTQRRHVAALIALPPSPRRGGSPGCQCYTSAPLAPLFALCPTAARARAGLLTHGLPAISAWRDATPHTRSLPTRCSSARHSRTAYWTSRTLENAFKRGSLVFLPYEAPTKWPFHRRIAAPSIDDARVIGAGV